jgi:hypothetical protein
MLTTAGIGSEVEYVVDINPHKAGKFLPGTGHSVMAPEHIRRSPPDVIIAMNPVYVGEIRERISSLGVAADVIPA